MRVVFGRVWRLSFLVAAGPQAWIGFVLFGIVLLFVGVDLYVDVLMIDWTGRFFDAVEQVDVDGTIRELGIFAILVLCSAGIFLVSDYLRKWLLLRWRAQLTDRALDAWTKNDAYWHLRPGLSAEAVDNPDQRVAEDCRRFVELLLLFSFDLLGRIAGVVTYVIVLWNLSDFVLSFSVFGFDVAIPRYMVWLALLYVLVSSVITHYSGRPLKDLFFRQEQREADFRYTLIQLRDNATEIAQSGGKSAERRRLVARFDGIRRNWFKLIRREFILGLFVRPYFQTILRVPTFFALPAYFAGSVTFGGLMQMAGTYSRVTTTLSWFIFNYDELAEFTAVAQRLDDLFRATTDLDPVDRVATDIALQIGTDQISTQGLQLATPDGRWLSAVPDIRITSGERVWITGPSGSGKSTLIAALTGLWRYGSGHVVVPDASLLVMPPRPHVFNEGLAAAACYPSDPADMDPKELDDILCKVGLSHRLSMMDISGAVATEGLSLGERQRLAMARVLLHRPDWVVLDEATSSLDLSSEAHLLSLLRQRLPDVTILCIAHREPVALDPTTTWKIGLDKDVRKTA